jgi:hypothetical protein
MRPANHLVQRFEGKRIGKCLEVESASISLFCYHNVSDAFFVFRLNAYIASGFSSAMMGARDGPPGLIKGFVVGYSFMYVLDKVSLRSPISLLLK